MRLTTSVIVVVLAAVLAPVGLAADRQSVLETSLTRQINAVRHDHGLRPLVVSRKLSAAAVQHTREMGAEGYFRHESRDGSEFWKRIEHWYSPTGWSTWNVGENLLYSSPNVSAAGALATWMESPPHRANIFDRTWREIGIAAIHFDVAPGEYGDAPVTIVTADFGARR